METTVTKGTRVLAKWYDAALTCLAGMQLKLGAREREVTGTVRHIYGTSPTDPDPDVFLDPDSPWDGPVATDCSCGKPHVKVRWRHVVAALPPADVRP